MGKASAPPAPDYASAAKETAAGNLENARSTTKANRVNTFTPYGSLTYTNGQGFDQAGYDAAMAKYNAQPTSSTSTTTGANTGGYAAGWDNESGFGSVPATTSQTTGADTRGAAPRREDFMTGDPDQWSAKVELSPDQQALLDQQNKTSLNLAGLQDGAASRVASALSSSFDMSSVPGRSALGPMGSVFDPNTLPGYRNMGTTYSERQKLAGAYDPNKAPKLSPYYDPQQDTNNATQAIMSRVAPQLERDRSALQSRLANQGIVQGSEAYKNAVDDFGRQSNDAYIQAGLQGIDLGMKQQGQNFGQSAQGINTGMAQQGQMFGQTLQNAGFRQGEQAQQFGQTNQNWQNSAAQRAQAAAEQQQRFQQQQQNYANSFNARNQSDAERQASIQEQAYLRSLPLNELNALRTGAQVTNPTFTNAPQQNYTAGPDMLGAANSTYQAALNSTNAQNAGEGNFMSGLFGLGGAALSNPALMAGMFSDRRLKTNIVKVGEQDGYGVYEYDIFGRRERGVMAQEVMWVKPMAVHMHSSGYLQVDYGSL
jgi:hypothetical protein